MSKENKVGVVALELGAIKDSNYSDNDVFVEYEDYRKAVDEAVREERKRIKLLLVNCDADCPVYKRLCEGDKRHD